MEMSPDLLRDLLASFHGDENLMNVQVKAKREGTEQVPSLDRYSPSDLAQADRFSQGMQIGRHTPLPLPLALPATAVMGGGYEAMKAISPGVLSLIGKALGDPSYSASASTSPASLSNVTALLRGVMHAKNNPR